MNQLEETRGGPTFFAADGGCADAAPLPRRDAGCAESGGWLRHSAQDGWCSLSVCVLTVPGPVPVPCYYRTGMHTRAVFDSFGKARFWLATTAHNPTFRSQRDTRVEREARGRAFLTESESVMDIVKTRERVEDPRS